MDKNKTYFFIFILLGISISYVHFFGQYVDKRATKFYIFFNHTEINDKIINISEYSRGIKLVFDSKEVVFYPLTSKVNNNQIFSFTAEKGDWIIKKAFRDTLILKKKNGRVIKYTFQKF